MKTLYEPAAVQEIRERIAQLKPDSVRQWGKMNAPQALAHCATGLEMAVGDLKLNRLFVGRIIGRFAKPVALGPEPLRRNSPTAKDLVVKDDRDLEVEQKRLLALIDRYSRNGATGCTTHPHPFFGTLSATEWATLMYKHLDHHLRQFGV
ncbi:MAG: DUF1569 domain-containing protein [Bryobacteraceae bacterium]|nr:DUF1569 domain-containing protein [Bryobacteraceae bacterium]